MKIRAFTLMSRKYFMRLALALFIAMCFPVMAEEDPRKKARLELFAEESSYKLGSTALITARMTIEPGWHTNSHQPTYPYLIPTEVHFELPEGWKDATVTYPPGKMQTFAFAQNHELSVYEGEVPIIGSISIPADVDQQHVSIRAGLRYQACDDRNCLPPAMASASLELTIANGESNNQ